MLARRKERGIMVNLSWSPMARKTQAREGEKESSSTIDRRRPIARRRSINEGHSTHCTSENELMKMVEYELDCEAEILDRKTDIIRHLTIETLSRASRFWRRLLRVRFRKKLSRMWSGLKL